MNVIGWRCAVCGAEVPIAAVHPWRCPRSTDDDRHHVLQVVSAGPLEPAIDDPNPFIAYDGRLAWAAFANAHGMDREARASLVRELDDQIAVIAGTGFVRTPMARADALSDALGFTASGGIWVKDETGNVAGSQKARHLVTILLQLRAAEELDLAAWGRRADRPPLAISSCGNAAIAASTLAASVGWPIRVFVPPWASVTVLAMLQRLGADVQVCPRLDTDPPGDPCIHRFREAVAAGAIPFGVQGPENALCLDGGRTLGWELLDAGADAGTAFDDVFDDVFVQVGGGAFAACMGRALIDVADQGGLAPRLRAVQAEGCAPLAGAWRRALALTGGAGTAAQHWDDCMRVWGSDGEAEPASLADGILDDETYDWIGIVQALVATDGDVVVASEAQVVEAHQLLRDTTGIDATATGTAGLAGVLAARSGGDARVAVVASGVTRY